MPVTPTHRRLRLEDCREFEATIGYIVSLRPPSTTEGVSKNKPKKPKGFLAQLVPLAAGDRSAAIKSPRKPPTLILF